MLGSWTGALAAGAGPPPDMVMINGQIRTPGGWSEAMAVRGGVITALGDSAAIRAQADAHTRVVDLGGRAVLPGLHDSHVHPLFAGLEQFACRLPQAAAAADVVAAVKGCAARAAPGEWILGGNWVAAAFRPGEQTRALLDAAAPANPVLLNDEAHHSIWVNSPTRPAASSSGARAGRPTGCLGRTPRGSSRASCREPPRPCAAAP